MNGSCTFDIARTLGGSGFCTGMTPVASTAGMMELDLDMDTGFGGNMRFEMDQLELL